MCCGAQTVIQSQEAKAASKPTKIIPYINVPKPVPKGVSPEVFRIPQRVKEQLIVAQQLARLPKKSVV